jgi:hypothetical protein
MRTAIKKDAKGRPFYCVLAVNAWEDLEPFVTLLTARLHGKIIGKYDTALDRTWEVLFDDEVINFYIDDYHPLTIYSKRLHGIEQLKTVMRCIEKL